MLLLALFCALFAQMCLVMMRAFRSQVAQFEALELSILERCRNRDEEVMILEISRGRLEQFWHEELEQGPTALVRIHQGTLSRILMLVSIPIWIVYAVIAVLSALYFTDSRAAVFCLVGMIFSPVLILAMKAFRSERVQRIIRQQQIQAALELPGPQCVLLVHNVIDDLAPGILVGQRRVDQESIAIFGEEWTFFPRSELTRWSNIEQTTRFDSVNCALIIRTCARRESPGLVHAIDYERTRRIPLEQAHCDRVREWLAARHVAFGALAMEDE